MENDDAEKYLAFELVLSYFNKTANYNNILSWIWEELSDQSITPATSDNNPGTALNYINTKLQVKVDGTRFKRHNWAFDHK